jgi:hypothetical protein
MNARDAYFYCIRAETVSIPALLFELLAAVGPGGLGGGGGSIVATALEAHGWDQRRQPSATRTPQRSRRGLAVAVAALVAAAGGEDQRQEFSILEHSMFLSLRKTNCFTSICSPAQQCSIVVRQCKCNGGPLEKDVTVVGKDLPACNC